MVYEDRYVVFLDILGFSSRVMASGQNEEDALAVLAALTAIKRDHELDKAVSTGFRYQTFSDSVVMSCPANPAELVYLFHSVEQLMRELLANRMLIRGGISKGKLYHSDEVIFGPAYLDAYRIESSVARYPRVVLSKEVYKDHKEYRVGVVQQANDGPPFLDVLHRLSNLNDLDPANRHLIEWAALAQCNLQQLIDDAMHEPNHYEKLKWLATYWNKTVKAFGAIKTVRFPVDGATWSL